MPTNDAGKAVSVDALDTAMAYMSAHSAYSTSGANEMSGGSYARQATARDAASGGEADLTAAETIPIPAGATVRFVGWWSALTSGTFYGMAPLHGSANPPKIFTALAADDVFTSIAHGFSDTDTVVLFGASLPTGITEGDVYYVRDATTNTFKLAATSGGAAIDLTGDGFGILQAITPETFGSAGDLEVSGAVMGLNLITT